MTEEEKLSTLELAATYQAQLDTLTRTRDGYRAQIVTLDGLIFLKKASLEEVWTQLRAEVGSGQ